MKKYQKLIEEYSCRYYEGYCEKETIADWNNTEKVIAYLDKYHLSREEYETVWKQRRDNVFINLDHKDEPLPLLFKPEFMIHPTRGGNLFCKEDFLAFQKGMQRLEETHFVVLENYENLAVHKEYDELLSFKFPTSISWEEMLNGGNYVSNVLCSMCYYQYCILGESNTWGMFVDNESDSSLRYLGVKPECKNAFTEFYNLPDPYRHEIINRIPKAYFEKARLIL